MLSSTLLSGVVGRAGVNVGVLRSGVAWFGLVPHLVGVVTETLARVRVLAGDTALVLALLAVSSFPSNSEDSLS